jgi:hypothetical protein
MDDSHFGYKQKYFQKTFVMRLMGKCVLPLKFFIKFPLRMANLGELEGN